MQLQDARAEVREETQHTDDERVTNARVTRACNRAYLKLRAKLASDVPTLYLATSDEISLSDGEDISMVDTAFNIGNIEIVERLDACNESWYPLERAGRIDYNNSIHRKLSFRIENLCIILGPDSYDTSGTYRVKFHPEPAELRDGLDDTVAFVIPRSTKQAFIYWACAYLMITDREGPAAKTDFDKLAQAEYNEALPALKARYGAHDDTAGLRKVRW